MPHHVAHQSTGNSTNWAIVVLAILTTMPGVFVATQGIPLSDPMRALIYGVAIVGAAFLLSWAAEVAQLDVSQGLAFAALALIAILPEYIVDASFAWLAAEDPVYAGYAVANMTGANRLLIGIAWPMVVFIGWLRYRQRVVELPAQNRLELSVLLVATLYAFILPLKGSISLLDMAVLVGLFGVYIWRLTRQPTAESPHLVGPALTIGALSAGRRRMTTAALAVGAAIAILLVAKPFAKALVGAGITLGIDEFLLVQWLAPLASEAPEFVVVALFAWRGLTAPALATLVSSKINQWTLLVAMLPLVFSLAKGFPASLPLDDRQQSEVLLTAAQSLFALVLILDRRFSITSAAMVFGLFMVQVILPDTRGLATAAYAVLTVGVLVRNWRQLGSSFRELRNISAPRVTDAGS
jgi:cation:H+ antiporter